MSQSAVDVSRVDADAIGGLSSLFSAYFEATKELGIEGNAELQRRLPEFFLTHQPQRTQGDMTLHVLFEEQTPKRKELEAKLRAAAEDLGSSGINVVYHEASGKETLHRTLAVSGDSYFLNQKAARQLSQLPVNRDAYGVYQTIVFIVLGLLWLALTVMMLLVFDMSALIMEVVGTLLLLGLLMGLLSIPKLPFLRNTMTGKRNRLFGEILSQCQAMGKASADADLLMDVPPHILDLLRGLPAEPNNSLLLSQDQWRLGEMRDIAQRAVEQLAQFPESSPDYPRRLSEVEKILRTVQRAFEANSEEAAQFNPLEEFHQEVTRHAHALGLGTHAKIEPIPMPDRVKR